MSSSIGGLSFVSLRGPIPQSMGQALRDITRPGVDGVAYAQEGVRPAPFQLLSSADVADAEDAEDLRDSYLALKGALATLVDDRGRTTNNVAVEDVMVQEPIPIAGAGGGLVEDPAYLVKALWTLRCTEIPA